MDRPILLLESQDVSQPTLAKAQHSDALVQPRKIHRNRDSVGSSSEVSQFGIDQPRTRPSNDGHKVVAIDPDNESLMPDGRMV